SGIPLKFTGDEYDSESASNHTLFRQQFPSQGRWSSPDPADLASANLAFPQSWNRYAYVMNNPLALTDPTGLVCNGVNKFMWDPLANGTGIFTPEDCAANGGSWSEGSGCVLDGAEIPCGMLMNIASSPGNAALATSGRISAPGGILAFPVVNWSQDPDIC